MSDIIDRAAWAVCPSLEAALHGEERQCKNCPAVIQTQFGPGTQYCRHVAEKAARATIAAMHNPTSEMLQAGATSVKRSAGPYTAALGAWCHMIEDALARGIEARSDETRSGSVHESPTASPPGDAPKLDQFP